MNKKQILERFNFSHYNFAQCPICDNITLSVVSATDRSIKLECSNESCKKTYFYRRVDNI